MFAMTETEKSADIKEAREKIKNFAVVCEKFYNGELKIPEYKSISGGFGTYSERGHKTGMLRLRIPAGILKIEHFKFILDSIEKYNIEKIHFTTNQSVQLHNLKPEVIPKLMLECFDIGINTLGGGGDNPRNVLCSPLSGVEKGEYFDVSPCALAASEFLSGLIGKIKLPRKLKVGFSNSPKNIVHATYRDMGFVAKSDGKFDLYTAGGLGVNPEFGIKTVSDVEQKDEGAVVYSFDEPIKPSNPMHEHSETANIIADSNLWYINTHTKTQKADFAFVNSGTIRGVFDEKITTDDIENTLPFTTSILIKAPLTKKQIINTLNWCNKSTTFEKVSPGIMQVSGMEYTINPDLSVSDVHILNEDGTIKYNLDDFDDESEFMSVYDIYLMTGALGLDDLKKEPSDKNIEYFNVSRQQALFEYLLNQNPINDYQSKRIKFLK